LYQELTTCSCAALRSTKLHCPSLLLTGRTPSFRTLCRGVISALQRCAAGSNAGRFPGRRRSCALIHGLCHGCGAWLEHRLCQPARPNCLYHVIHFAFTANCASQAFNSFPLGITPAKQCPCSTAAEPPTAAACSYQCECAERGALRCSPVLPISTYLASAYICNACRSHYTCCTRVWLTSKACKCPAMQCSFQPAKVVAKSSNCPCTPAA